MRRLLLVLVTLAGISGCAFDPVYSDLTCDAEGAERSGQRCESGVWVNDLDADEVPADMGGGGDVTVARDMSPAEDIGGSDTPCSAESDAFFCERLGKTCGEVTDDDNCGDARTVGCGVCDAATETCAVNVCELVPETDQELCDAAGATCDDITVMDRTGAMRSANCGMCASPLQCGVGGTPNTCACLNANDQQFCADNGATCGPITAMDAVCMLERTVNCGTCNQPETCGGGGTANVCGCVESDVEFCARIGRNCGPVTDTDACGMSRTVNCGSCSLPESCGGGGQAGTCGCTTSNACFANSAQCGTVDVTGMCSNIATADCGGCGANGMCLPNYTCMCDSGYTFDGMDCVDVNECTTGADNCSANATCANTVGSFTCTCDSGYTGNGVTCTDINECNTGADNCDANATCANNDGGFSCACNSGYMGNGVTCSPIASNPPVVVDSTTGDQNANDTVTTGNISGVDDDLYVAFISMRTTSRTVDSIAGLGLTWQLAQRNCNASDQQNLEVWTARGNTNGDGNITVNLSNAPFATAVAVYRVTNMPSGGATGVSAIHNSNGQDGACNGSNPESNYSFTYTPQYANSLILTGTAIEEFAHTPGTDWTELDEVHRGGGMDRDAGLATMSRENTATTGLTVSGSTSQQNNWVTGVFEVRGL